jgi:predicted membrane-bound dolichyl-phosphate-mannose-protein mannosyltransferase
LLAAALLSLDNLEFVHSRIFTLDIFQMAFMLLGAYLYLSRRPTLSGAGFALAALCKIGGAFGLAAMVAYEGLRLVTSPEPWQQRWRPVARRLARMVVTFVLVFLPLLGVMDRLWTGYSQPLEHLQHIISYGTLLRREIPSGIESYPWQWLWNERQIPYLQVDQQVKVGEEVREKRPIIQFLGAMNPYVLGLLPLGLAIAAYVLRRRQQEGRDLAAFSVAWFAMTYLPFIAASVFGQRISYLFYFLPTLPAITLSGAYFLRETGLPRLVMWGYGAAVLLAFYGYFPFKPVP